MQRTQKFFKDFNGLNSRITGKKKWKIYFISVLEQSNKFFKMKLKMKIDLLLR